MNANLSKTVPVFIYYSSMTIGYYPRLSSYYAVTLLVTLFPRTVSSGWTLLPTSLNPVFKQYLNNLWHIGQEYKKLYGKISILAVLFKDYICSCWFLFFLAAKICRNLQTNCINLQLTTGWLIDYNTTQFFSCQAQRLKG